jgi:uncharacterized protein (DUF433 family)
LKKFEDILAQCIEDIKAGRSSIEDCLDRYPSLREQLEPLLRIALAIREPPDAKPSPAFKIKARVQLMDQIHERRTVTKWPWPRYNNQVRPKIYSRRFSVMKPKVWKPVVASLAVLFLAVSVYMVFLAPRAVATLALQVNPAVTLTLDERNIVIEAKGLDARGVLLLAGLDVIDKEVLEALLVIARALHEAGLLEDGRRMLISLQPVEGRIGEAELTILTDAVSQTLQGYVAEHRLLVVVVSVSLTAELADAVHAAGLLPADYVDLVDAVGAPTAVEVLALQGELGLDQALFKEELGTIAAALEDMIDAGITPGNALPILKSSLAADPTLEELTTIIAAMIDLHEVGATQENIMAVFSLVEERVAAGVERELLLEEFTTITAEVIDMMEAGITGANSLAILEGALAADPTLEELTTITAAMIDLHEAGATQENIMAVFNLTEAQVAAGLLDRDVLLEEFSTNIAAKIDMLDAGIPAGIALDVLKIAMEADPTLEELTTITAAMIDLIEQGLSTEEALARIQDAIEADPTLQNFDDLIGLEPPENEEQEEQRNSNPDRPQPGRPSTRSG